MTGPDESVLAERISAGDRTAEVELVARYLGRVTAMAVARTRDREAAREIANDVLMAVVGALRRGSVLDTTRIGAFVHGTAVNLINNFLRTSKRKPPLVTLEVSAIEDIPADDADGGNRDVESLDRCLSRLSPLDRRVLVLSLVEGLKPGEIAGRTGQTAEAVRQQKSRALARLKLLLAESSRNEPGEPQ